MTPLARELHSDDVSFTLVSWDSSNRKSVNSNKVFYLNPIHEIKVKLLDVHSVLVKYLTSL